MCVFGELFWETQLVPRRLSRLVGHSFEDVLQQTGLVIPCPYESLMPEYSDMDGGC